MAKKPEDGAEPELRGSKGNIEFRLKGADGVVGFSDIVVASLEVDVVWSRGVVKVNGSGSDVELVDIKKERVFPGFCDVGNVIDCSPSPLTEVTDSYVRFQP